ncbi:MAG: glutamate synthase subunit beta [Nitrospiria bacterium]
MSDPRGFLKFQRKLPRRRPLSDRLHDWRETVKPVSQTQLQEQGARCMDCGVPFCQGWTGCPVQNAIPDWNDFVHRNQWKQALQALHTTNNFPEFTGRLCPAPCESACVLGIIDEPVTIRFIEWKIIEKGFSEGWVRPIFPKHETGRRIAVIGSGPAGLAAAQQLRRGGHTVVVFEKADRLGGLLRYGIPDFRMEKWVLDRRLEQMRAEGVVFKTNVEAGKDISADMLRKQFDAICLAVGAAAPRDLPVPGRTLKGIHFAMDYLTQQNRRVAGDAIDPDENISAKGKRVMIIGGGDTGADCLGTSHRQGAIKTYQLSRRDISDIEILTHFPPQRSGTAPYPLWSKNHRPDSTHEEEGDREWRVLTKGFSSQGNRKRIETLRAVKLKTLEKDMRQNRRFVEIKGSGFDIKTDLVLLAMGFIGPVKEGLLSDLDVQFDSRGSVVVDENHMTSIEGVFAAGDVNLGASLLVWAIQEGREAARGIDQYLRTLSK